VKLLRTTEVKLSALKLRGGWEKEVDDAHVRRLADEIEAGAILPPIRIDEGKGIVFGYHRVAAHKLAGRTVIAAEVVELERPDEAEAAALGENLHRRNITGEQRAKCTARLVEIYAARFKEVSPQAAEKPAKGGRPKSPEREAIREVAKLREVSEDTVERDVKAAKAPEPQPPTPAAPPPIDCHGHALSDGVRTQVVEVQALLDEAANAMSRVVAALNKLEDLSPEVANNTFAQGLALNAREMNRVIRDRRPAHLCTHCRGGELRPRCPLCKGLGAISAELYARTPKDGGKPAKKQAKKVVVVDENGQPIATGGEP